MRELTADEKADAGVKQGVLVLEVKDGSPADDAGLSPNDVIEEIGGKPVIERRRLHPDAQGLEIQGKHAVLLVRRGDNSQFVPLSLGQ